MLYVTKQSWVSRHVVAVCATCLVVAVSPSAFGEVSVQMAVDHNSKSLAKINSYHFHIVEESPESVERGGPLFPMTEYEIWSSGINRRQFMRIFRTWGDDARHVPSSRSTGDTFDDSWGDKQVRSLRGWDPSHPYQLPLELGRNAKEFTTVAGAITARNPAERIDVIETSNLLWEIYPGWSLGKAAGAGTLALELPGDKSDKEKIRLRLTAASDPKLAEAIGLLVDVDPQHGWMVSRIERPNSGSIIEVKQFANPDTDVWIAQEVITTYKGNIIKRTAVKELSVNKPLSADLLVTSFPDGTRVDESTGDVHLCKNGKAERTFATYDAFLKHVKNQARDYQARGAAEGVGEGTGERAVSKDRKPSWVIFINIGIIVLLFAVIALRRKLGRADKMGLGSNGSS